MNFEGSVAGSVAGMLNISGDGDTINITPVLTEGEKIATFVINEGTSEEESIDLYAPEGFSGSWNDLTDKPNLFSGVYADLTGKPTLNGNIINGDMFTDNYSENEERVGTWIDGKPLYRKTIKISSKQSQIDISSLNIDTYVKGECAYRVGSYCFDMPRLSDVTQNYNNYISTYYTDINSGFINFLWGTNISTVDHLHIRIKYTKTTDSIE